MAGVGDIIEVWISDEEDLWWTATHQKYRAYRFQRCLLRAFFNPNHWLHDPCHEVRDLGDGTGKHLFRPRKMQDTDFDLILQRRERKRLEHEHST